MKGYHHSTSCALESKIVFESEQEKEIRTQDQSDLEATLCLYHHQDSPSRIHAPNALIFGTIFKIDVS